jgi:hypothetical protein
MVSLAQQSTDLKIMFSQPYSLKISMLKAYISMFDPNRYGEVCPIYTIVKTSPFNFKSRL